MKLFSRLDVPAIDPELTISADDRLDLRQELYRKLIHLATIVIPITIWFLPRPFATAFLAAGVVLALLVEGARRWVRPVRYIFLKRARKLLRRHEKDGLAGATYMAIGYLAAYLLFPIPVAVAAMLYNSLGDAAAAIVGKRWGYHRLSWGKSWEGAAAGAAANLLAGFAVPGLPAMAVLLGAFTAALLELLPIPLDDNIRVTVGGGVGGWAGLLLAGG